MTKSDESWSRVSLETAAEVRWGDTHTTKASYTPTGYLAYSASGPDGFMDHHDHEGPGIVLSAIGAQCGKTWFADGKWSCIKNTIYLKARSGVADDRFLYYATSRSDFWPKRGAAQPFISQGDARRCELLLPSLAAQRHIASILGAYDELIEVNRRRVAVLEEMARRLFEEWFVRFRFAGHDLVPLINTPEGPLPKGWKRATVGKAFTLTRGRSYRSIDLAEEGGLPFVNLKCMARDGGFRSSGLKRYTGDYKPGHIVVAGELVIAVTDMTQERRIVGRTARIPRLEEPAAVISMDLVKVCPEPGIDQTFLYSWLRNSDFGPTAAQHANGANVLHLSPKAVVDVPIVLPPAELQAEFGRRVEPLFSLAEITALADRRLAASRDLLLPRLISGQLSVEAAESELEQAA